MDIQYHKKLKDPCVCYLGWLGILVLERQSTKGEKGQACHGVEDVQSSPSRSWEEKRGAGRAQGYSKSKRCLSLVSKPEQRWQSWHRGALREMQNTWKAPAKGAGLDIKGLDCASQLACEWG